MGLCFVLIMFMLQACIVSGVVFIGMSMYYEEEIDKLYSEIERLQRIINENDNSLTMRMMKDAKNLTQR